MNTKKIFFKAPAECFVKLLDGKERDIGFNEIVCFSLARQHLATGHTFEECKSDLGIYFDMPDDSIKRGLEIMSACKDSVKFDIERNVFLDYLFSYKDEYERVLQIAFMALKSMIGRERTYCRVYNELWLLRMSGHTEYKGELHPIIKRYADPRKLRALKEDLSLGFKVNFSTKKTRGFLASTILSSEELDAKLEECKSKGEDTKAKAKAEQRKNQKKAKPDEMPTKKEEQPLWRTDFGEYKRLFEEAKKTLLADEEFRKKMEERYPNIDFEKSIDRSSDYWMSEAGWKKCKSYRSKNIDPVERFKRNFEKSKVYKSIYGGNNRPHEYRRKSGQYDNIDVNEWNKNM